MGALFSQAGKRAKKVKGRARARANLDIPIAGRKMLPRLTSLSESIMGPVHENETSVRVVPSENAQESLADLSLVIYPC